MFVDPGPAPTDYPQGSGFREQDWHVLASFWHPVAFAHDVRGAPVQATLLDVQLVIYAASGGVTVARDRCPHRGVQVSLGKMRDGRLVCPMHGIEFGGDGIARRVPSIPDANAPISPRMCLQTFLTETKYGIVWTCLKPEPLGALPDWPGISDPELKKVFVPVDEWQCSAARHTENFNDQAHFPFVHLESFGSDADVTTHDYEVSDSPVGMRFTYEYVEGGNRFPDDVEADEREVTYTYDLTFPFSTLITVDPVGSDFVHYFADAVCPVSINRTRIFQQLTDSFGDPDPDYWIADSQKILEEDRHLVESQPTLMPLTNADELHHIPADRWSIRYRQILRDRFGLGMADNALPD
jgi:phenylpropionate dioxygenase-like ring-hydroxylating dioxygenase large terminal subunit